MTREDAVRKNQEGLKLFQEGNYEEALRVFNEAIELDPEYGAPWFNRSDVYRKLGREAEADADRERWKEIRKKQQERDAEEAQRRQKEGTPLHREAKAPLPEEEEVEPAVPVQLEVEYPERLSRWQLFFKWLSVIPLYFILFFYGIGAAIVTFIAFWAILFTGRYPYGMFDFVQGYLDRLFNTYAYFPLLMTDSWMGDDVYYSVKYPERLSRLVLVFLKLPSFLLDIVPFLFGLVMYFLIILAIPAWFIILILGRYPRKLFNFNLRLFDWVARVMTWQYLMRDNWSLFGTTKPVRILVAIGLVAAIALVAISFTPIIAPLSPLAYWLGGAWYGAQGEAVVTEFMEAGRDLDIDIAVNLISHPIFMQNEVRDFIQQNRYLFEDFQDAQCTWWEYEKKSGTPAMLKLEGVLNYQDGDQGRFQAILLYLNGKWKIDKLNLDR